MSTQIVYIWSTYDICLIFDSYFYCDKILLYKPGSHHRAEEKSSRKGPPREGAHLYGDRLLVPAFSLPRIDGGEKWQFGVILLDFWQLIARFRIFETENTERHIELNSMDWLMLARPLVAISTSSILMMKKVKFIFLRAHTWSLKFHEQLLF